MNKLSVIEDEFMLLELGNEVHRQYMSIARQVMTYEKILLKQWVANIDSVAMNYLKMSILARDVDTGKIVVNFNKGLVKLMRETRYLDRMGLDIPEIPLNVTLQEESYSKCVLTSRHSECSLR
jgi:dynein heavy chain, axonemal